MKTRINRLVCNAVLVVFSLASASAASVPEDSLGLLRLRIGKGKSAAAVSDDKVSTDPLVDSAQAMRKTRNDRPYLQVEGTQKWQGNLRGTPNEATFASFLVYGGSGTVIDVGPARLGWVASGIDGQLQLMYDHVQARSAAWRPLNYHMPLERFDQVPLVAAPVLTVFVDPVAGLWHLFASGRAIAVNLPIVAERKNDRKFTVTAGRDGAWICGLVLSDQNPLYVDANVNGIDDQFETQTRGALLAMSAALAERVALAADWQRWQVRFRPTIASMHRPLPDRLQRNR